jgi:hypothetical protein
MTDGDESSKSKLTLVDSCKPQLTAGNYRLSAKQTLRLRGVGSQPVSGDGSQSGETLGLSGDGSQSVEWVEWKRPKEFWVSASRFVLGPDEVYSVYPPDGQSGAYLDTIPHVVFASKSLPWVRLLRGDNDAPWMALLLLDETECAKNVIEVTSRKLTEVKDPGQGIYRPDITLDPWEKKEDSNASAEAREQNEKLCMTVDVPWELFRKIAPRVKELKYLAHARKVTTGDKEDVAGIGDGGFSLLLGNRVPKEDKQYFAFVVSLEGLSGLIEDAPPSPPPAKVRLVVLSKWSFLSRGEKFKTLLENLASPQKDAWLRVTRPESVQNEAARTALELGYVPMRHQFRHGRSTMSWYRGPLVPLRIRYQPRTLIYRSADEALQLDPDVGLFDVSYAAAWQLGRLLALQAPDFARSLFYSETSYITDKLLKKAADVLKADVLKEAGRPAVEDESEILQNELMAMIALELCSSQLLPAG